MLVAPAATAASDAPDQHDHRAQHDDQNSSEEQQARTDIGPVALHCRAGGQLQENQRYHTDEDADTYHHQSNWAPPAQIHHAGFLSPL